MEDPNHELRQELADLRALERLVAPLLKSERDRVARWVRAQSGGNPRILWLAEQIEKDNI
jgi:hypothetical protein